MGSGIAFGPMFFLCYNLISMEIKRTDLNQLENLMKLISRDSTKFQVAGDEIPALTQMNQWLSDLRKRFVEDIKAQIETEKTIKEAQEKEVEENRQAKEILETLASQAKGSSNPKKKNPSKKKS